MGFYLKEKPQDKRWESGQSILHRQQQETKKDTHKQEDYALKNSYGALRYLKKDKKAGQDREGFSLEAFEAAGTPVHTQKEKHLDRTAMKKVSHGDKKTLFSSELPLRNQALFYDMSGGKKSKPFLKCMKELIRRQGHQTLRDAFGFLEQEPERLELEAMKDQQQRITPEAEKQYSHELTIEEFTAANRRIDTLSSRLHKKEAKEQQLCSELQTMLAQRAEDKQAAQKHLSQRPKHTWEEAKTQSNSRKKNSSDNRRVSMMFSSQNAAQIEPTGEAGTNTDSILPKEDSFTP